jgi:arylsulfatase A-like enzyme
MTAALDIDVTSKRKSLVLITVDCLRADHCGFQGYSRPTTPFLDVLSGESIVVPTAVVAGAPTYYSLPAILASRMPLTLGREVVGLAPGESTLASALHDAGYATAAFSAANPYISPRFGYDQGFELFEDFLDFGTTPAGAKGNPLAQGSMSPSDTRGKVNHSLRLAAQGIGLGLLYDELYFQYRLRVASPRVADIEGLRRFPSAATIIDRALAWLESVADQPFFLWLHLMDPHSPYYPPQAAYRELTGKEISASRARYLNEFWNRSDLEARGLQRKRDSVVAMYDAGIRAVDDQIARFVSQLRTLTLWDTCVLALTADHGEEFLDHGGRYHAPVNLHEEIARIPLVIRVPGARKLTAPTAAFSHLHLAPTLLNILDIPPPPSFQGTSLWRNLQQGSSWDLPAISECVYGCTNPLRRRDRRGARLVSVRTDRYKLIVRLEEGAAEELYDLEADPSERQPLQESSQKSIRARLLQAARTQIQANCEAKNAPLQLKARLRDLRFELQSKA